MPIRHSDSSLHASTFRVVGNPYLTGLGKNSPSSDQESG